MFGLFNSFSYADTVLNVYTWNLSRYAVNILNWNHNLWLYFDTNYHYQSAYFDKNWLSTVSFNNLNQYGYSNIQFVISYMYWWRNIKRYVSYVLGKYTPNWSHYWTYLAALVQWNWYGKVFSSPDISNEWDYNRNYSTNTYIAYTWYKLYFYSTVKNSDDIFGFYFDLTTWFNLHYFHWEKPDFNWITLNDNSIVYPVWNKLLIRKYNWIVLNSSWFVNSFDLKSVSLPVSSDRFTTWNSFVFSDYPYSYVYTNWNMTYLKWFVYKNWDKIESTTYDKSLYSWFSFSNGLFYGSKLLSGWIVEVDEISKSNTVALNSVLPVSNWSNNWSNSWNWNSNWSNWNWTLVNICKPEIYWVNVPYTGWIWFLNCSYSNKKVYCYQKMWDTRFTYLFSWFTFIPKSWGLLDIADSSWVVFYGSWVQKVFTWVYRFYVSDDCSLSSPLSQWTLQSPIVLGYACPISWDNNFGSSIMWFKIWWWSILGFHFPEVKPFGSFACLFNIVWWWINVKKLPFGLDLFSWGQNLIPDSAWWKLNSNYKGLWFWDIFIFLLIVSVFILSLIRK